MQYQKQGVIKKNKAKKKKRDDVINVMLPNQYMALI